MGKKYTLKKITSFQILRLPKSFGPFEFGGPTQLGFSSMDRFVYNAVKCIKKELENG